MIKKIVMKNLICSGCAGKIEKALTELNYINSASFNFANQVMLIDVTDNYLESKHLSQIKGIVDSIEHGVETYPYEKRNLMVNKSFVKKHWLMLAGLIIFALGYLLDRSLNLVRFNPLYWIGYGFIVHIIAIKTYQGIKRKDYFNENTLMFIATLAAMFIAKPFEAVAVLVFYTVGEHLQHRAVHRSKQEISSLMDLHVDYANVWINDAWVIRDPMTLTKGDKILVKNGEKIPVDGTVLKGRTSLNTSALTGETKLKSVEVGDYVHSGNINVGSVIEITAEKEYHESTIAKIIDLIENATNKKSKTENFITRFARFYTPFVTVAALIMFLVPTLFDPNNIEEYIFRAATFLVISCPCALVLSIPLSYFAGIGASARKGILFKGSNFLDMMNKVDVIGIDKTGTLTHGNFEVDGYTNLETLKLAASIEIYSNHPIASSIVSAYHDDLYAIEQVTESPGYGLSGILNEKVLMVGSRKFLIDQAIHGLEDKDTAGTNVFVAYDGKYVGRVVIKDQIKESSINVIKHLNRRFHLVMLTGDNKDTANEVAYALGGIDFRDSLLPEDKLNVFNEIKSEKMKMYVGDGINDAPLIKNADVGVAMGKGSELALDVADVIIMDDDLRTLKKAFTLSKRTYRIVIQNIVLSLGVKFLFLILASFGIATMWMAIFADVGITLIAVMNALRLIYGRGAKKL
ncbi:MAG: heavy metal translocating P-type ATPase [Candidatus Izemoplasmataceae bacterium]